MTVLQHPDESRLNKGTAIIAKLSLKNYQCWPGEDFSTHNALNQLIDASADSIAVVYPSATAHSINDYMQAGSRLKKLKHVIFIDATWRKAKKIWSLSTNLHSLPTLLLESDIKSNYRIRKVPADGYLSTIEAIARCLSVFDEDEVKYQPMLNVFDSMIEFQIDKMGSDTYAKNYEKE